VAEGDQADPVAEIERARLADLVDEDGRQVVLELGPGLSQRELETLEAEVGVPLPGELRAVLERAATIDGALEQIDFSGRTLSFEDRDLFPAGLPIAHDGFGNHWVLDLTPNQADVAPVFFACHDAPVVLFQAPGIGSFLHEAFRMFVPPHASLVDDVHEDRPFNVWRTNPRVLDHDTALAGDADLRAFATELDDQFVFVDLREPEIGMGFSWGRYGPRTRVRRHGYERLFAYARPEQRPGLLRRIFG